MCPGALTKCLNAMRNRWDLRSSSNLLVSLMSLMLWRAGGQSLGCQFHCNILVVWCMCFSARSRCCTSMERHSAGASRLLLRRRLNQVPGEERDRTRLDGRSGRRIGSSIYREFLTSLPTLSLYGRSLEFKRFFCTIFATRNNHICKKRSRKKNKNVKNVKKNVTKIKKTFVNVE